MFNRSFPLQFKEDKENIEAKLVKIYSASHTEKSLVTPS